jgi:hypothetical protein
MANLAPVLCNVTHLQASSDKNFIVGSYVVNLTAHSHVLLFFAKQLVNSVLCGC